MARVQHKANELTIGHCDEFIEELWEDYKETGSEESYESMQEWLDFRFILQNQGVASGIKEVKAGNGPIPSNAPTGEGS